MSGGWFLDLFGFQEETGTDGYKITQAKFKYDAKTGVLQMADDPTTNYVAGQFANPSLAELRKRVDLKKAQEELNARGATGRCSLEEKVDDVSALHVLPENKGATFQAASQFNCLEHTSEEGLPEHGITCYSFDRTQGPACAIACAPGTVVRNYKVKQVNGVATLPGSTDDPGEGQDANRQIENLRDIESLLCGSPQQNKFFKVVSGYTMANNNSLEKLNQRLQDVPKEDVCAALRIGVQADTQVTHYAFGQRKCEIQNQMVTQAYCSAISVSYSRASSSLWEPFARIILEASFEACFYAAVEAALRRPDWPGSRKLYLTALGGGVFGNDLKWIADAIDAAMVKFENIPLEVYVVSFRVPTTQFGPLFQKWGKRQ